VSETPTVHDAIAAVMDDIGVVPKVRHDGGVSYAFQGIADILAKAQPSFVRHHVMLTPHEIVHYDQKDRTTRNGGSQVQADLLIRWRLYGPAGDWVEAMTWGHAFDTSDKAFNKAMTAAQKYALKLMLSIPDSEDDQDNERPELGEPVQAPRPMTKAQAKTYLKDTIGADRAKAVWAGMDLDHAQPWSRPELDDAVVAFDAQAEPFPEPTGPVTIPAKVDRDTGEVLVPEQTIHPQGTLEDLAADAVMGGEK
jgi:hypothetical protein